MPAWVKPVGVESQYRSRDELMADPKATPVDTDLQLIHTEAALRAANSVILRVRDLYGEPVKSNP